VGGVCQPNGRQYDVVAGGNALLKPEKSRQAGLGIVFEPMPALTVSADYWWLSIKDAFGQISEQEAFDNPGSYPGSWTTQLDIATNVRYLAYNQANLNLGKNYYSGIDFNVQGRTPTPIGQLTTQLQATYMLRERAQLQPGGQYFNPIGVNEASLAYVTVRWQGKAQASLRTGAFTNTLGLNFKSGYKDAVANVEVLGANDANTGVYEDIQLDVKRYYTLDFQTQWQVAKNFTLTAGVLNLTDEQPFLSLAQGGLGKGQMFGYDDRYHDVRGRTLYINAGFTF
jgi:iron complex outermembrane receptor protein